MPLEVELEREVAALAGEVLVELPGGGLERRRLGVAAGRAEAVGVALEVHAGQRALARR